MDGFNSVFTGTAYVVSLIYSSLYLGIGSAFICALLSLGAGYLTNLLMDDAPAIPSTRISVAVFPAAISAASAILSTAILVEALL